MRLLATARHLAGVLGAAADAEGHADVGLPPRATVSPSLRFTLVTYPSFAPLTAVSLTRPARFLLLSSARPRAALRRTACVRCARRRTGQRGERRWLTRRTERTEVVLPTWRCVLSGLSDGERGGMSAV